jgi:hypothetical protein
MNAQATSLTSAGEIGTFAAEAIRELVSKATSGAMISTYIESGSPLAWDEITDGGWDQVGVVEDGEGATLRDLVEIALVWGEQLLPLPFTLSIVANRHSSAARESDSPLSFAVPLVSLEPGTTYVPFGQFENIKLLRNAGKDPGQILEIPAGTIDDLALSMHGLEVVEGASMSPAMARDLAILLSAECVGGARQLLANGVEYVKTRKQFGKPIGSFQAIKHHLANALIAVELAETTVIWASVDETTSTNVLLSAIDQCIEAAEITIQVHGGLGFTWEMGLHFYLRHMMLVREMVPGLIDISTAE